MQAKGRRMHWKVDVAHRSCSCLFSLAYNYRYAVEDRLPEMAPLTFDASQCGLNRRSATMQSAPLLSNLAEQHSRCTGACFREIGKVFTIWFIFRHTINANLLEDGNMMLQEWMCLCNGKPSMKELHIYKLLNLGLRIEWHTSCFRWARRSFCFFTRHSALESSTMPCLCLALRDFSRVKNWSITSSSDEQWTRATSTKSRPKTIAADLFHGLWGDPYKSIRKSSFEQQCRLLPPLWKSHDCANVSASSWETNACGPQTSPPRSNLRCVDHMVS